MPRAFIFAGINGAGKSTIYYDELLRGRSFGIRINTDEFVSSFGSWKNPHEQFKAAKIALKLRQNCIANRSDFNQETTLCGKSIVNLFSELKVANYDISLYYIGVNSANIAKERVQMRIAKGGHGIDFAIIDKRFDESLQNLLKVVRFCDEILLFDNSGRTKKLIFKKQNNCIVDKILPQNAWIYENRPTLQEILGK
ncbi:zeta toxin family protein [Helicobacter sp. 23-1044]